MTVGGELYDGFRFTVPDGHGDLIWAFVIPPNVRSWYILCAREDSGDGFDSFNTKSVNRLIVPRGLRLSTGNTMVFQSLEASKLTTGQQYLIWFHFTDRSPVTMSIAPAFGRGLFGDSVAASDYYPTFDLKEQPAGSESDDDCFFVTAACVAMGKSSRCRELNLLRRFRDSYVVQTSQGRRLVEEYYQNAPAMVAACHTLSDAPQFWLVAYKAFVRETVDLIDGGRLHEAVIHYQAQFKNVQAVLEISHHWERQHIE